MSAWSSPLQNIRVPVHKRSSLVGPRSVSGADPEGELPQSLLCQVIIKVIEKGNDVTVRLQRVGPGQEDAHSAHRKTPNIKT